MLFERIKKAEKLDENADKIKKQPFVNYWKKNCENCDVGRRVFNLLAQHGSNYIVPEDFKPLFKYLLDTHPGLEFLQATPEF